MSPTAVCLPQIKDLGEQLKEHEKNLVHLQDREKALITQFMEKVGEGNKYKDFLLKVSDRAVHRGGMETGGVGCRCFVRR